MLTSRGTSMPPLHEDWLKTLKFATRSGQIWTLAADDPLTVVQSIELPRVEGRIDHLAFDAAGQHLFIAALGNNTVEVLDMKAATHVRSLPGFHERQGIEDANRFTRIAHIATAAGARTSLFVPELNRLFLAIPHRGSQRVEIRIFDAH